MAPVFQFVILSSDLRETLEPLFAKNLHCRESSSRKQPAARVQTERFKTLTTRTHAVLFRTALLVCLIPFYAAILISAKRDRDFGAFKTWTRLSFSLSLWTISYSIIT